MKDIKIIFYRHTNLCYVTEKISQYMDRFRRSIALSLTCFMAVLLFSGMSSRDTHATTYYVDASAAAGGDGLLEATAWNSLTVVNNRMGSFVGGDRIRIKRGETFNLQQLTITASGDPGNPIIFEAYGDSALPLPVIDGGMILNNWTSEGGNIYSCPWGVTSTSPLPLTHILYYKGVPKRPITTLSFSSVPPELQPNAILLQLVGYYSNLLVTSATADTVSGITSFIIREDKSVYVRQVENGLEKQWPTSLGTPTIISSTEGLTEPGHWYWDAATERIYLYADASPNNNSTVAVGFMDNGIWVNSSHDVTIQDIKIQNTNGQGIYLTNSSEVTVQRVSIFGGGAFAPSAAIKRKNGIQLIYSSDNTIQNNTIDSVVTSGVTVYADSYSASSNNEILSNTVTNTGGAGISLSMPEVTGNNISGNNISKANALSYDGAGVYTFYAGPDNIIQSNTIRDCGSSYLRSAGVMVDNAAAPIAITNNTIENNSKGGIVVSGAGHQITSNMLRNNGVSSWVNAEVLFFTSTIVASDCTVTGNTMEADQSHHFIYVNAGNDSGHTINNNTYRGQSTEQFFWPNQWMDFETWKSSTGHDADSTFEGSNLPPNIPTSPIPADGVADISVSISLQWIGGDPDYGDSVTYEVYLEAENPTPGILICNETFSTSCDPNENLNNSTTYYWRVVARDDHGLTTSSPTWSFTTEFCNYNGTCDVGEDCNNCPSDCIGGEGGDAVCGNGICEPGIEDCLSCPADCAGKQNGKLSKQFCCGDGLGINPVGCEDTRCSSGEFECGDLPQSYCCGDSICEGPEDSYNCELDCGEPFFCGDGACDSGENYCNCPGDCGSPPASEENCSDSVDNDCDGFTDCDDLDCAGGVTCTCYPKDTPCNVKSDCCSNKCVRGACK